MSSLQAPVMKNEPIRSHTERMDSRYICPQFSSLNLEKFHTHLTATRFAVTQSSQQRGSRSVSYEQCIIAVVAVIASHGDLHDLIPEWHSSSLGPVQHAGPQRAGRRPREQSHGVPVVHHGALPPCRFWWSLSVRVEEVVRRVVRD